MSFTVLTAEFSHETNTFNCKPADYAAFAAQGIQLGDDAIDENRSARPTRTAKGKACACR